MKKYSVKVNGNHILEIPTEELLEADIIPLGNQTYHLIKDGNSYEYQIQQFDLNGKKMTIRSRGKIFEVKIDNELDKLISTLGLETQKASAEDIVKAPMPGLVLELCVEEGDSIKEGDKLLILEAMKMENVIKASADVEIAEVLVEKGQGVEKNQPLIKFK